MKKLLLGAALVSFMSTPAFAGVADGWSGEASLAGSKTTGNTDTTDLGLALHLEKESDLWRHKFNASYDFGTTSDVDNKERLFLGYQIDRDLNDRLYVYGNANYYNDKFGAYSEGYFLGTGLGYKVIVPEPIGWDVEAGIGFRSQEAQGLLNTKEEEVALRGASNFDYKFNENVSFYNDSEILWGDSDTYIWNETGITAQLMGNLAARASFRVDTHSDVPVGTKKTDTITRVGVVYTIK